MKKRVALLAFLFFILPIAEIQARQHIKIVFWEWWADRQETLEEFAAEYRKLTGVEVKFELAAPVGRDYWNKIHIAALANQLPDIIAVAGGGMPLPMYIRSGKIVDLTREMNAGWKNRFFKSILERMFYNKTRAAQYQIKPNTWYGVPLSAMNIQFVYNKKLFRRAGLNPDKPPETLKEFVFTCRKLKAAGITPFVTGMGDLWMTSVFVDPYRWAYLGRDGMKNLVAGDKKYSSPGMERALKILEIMRDEKLFYSGIVSLPNKEAEQLFARERVAIAMNGSWSVNVYRHMNPSLEMAVMPPPVPKDAPYPLHIVGGVGGAASVTTNSKHPEEAIKFLKWFTDTKQQVRYSNKVLNLSSNRLAVAAGLDQVLAQFADDLDRIAPDLGVKDEPYFIREVFQKGIQSIVIGEKDIPGVLEEAQRKKMEIQEGERHTGKKPFNFMKILYAIFIIGGLYMAFNVLRQVVGTRRTLLTNPREGVLFILPALLLFLVFGLYPFIQTFFLSFYKTNGIEKEFVGFKNYVDIFSRNGVWWQSICHVAIIAGIALVVQNLFALLLALAVDSDIKGKKYYRLIFYLPPILSVIVIGIIWRWVFNNDFGILNHVLRGMGLGSLIPYGGWLQNKHTALLSVTVVTIWQGFGNAFLIFLAGLQTIPRELYEAADVDGANGFEKFMNITIPLLKPVITVVGILTVLGTMQAFAIIMSMTGGGPGFATEVPVTRIFKRAFESYQFGYATAMAMIFGIILMILSFIQIQITKEKYT